MTNSSTPAKKPERLCHKNKTCCSGKISSYSCKVRCMATVCLLLIAAAVALLYFLLRKPTTGPERFLALPKKSDWFPQCPTQLLIPEERFDCYPDHPSVDQATCKARGCCYLGSLVTGSNDDNDTTSSKVPTCVYPKNYGYAASGKAEMIFNGFEVPLQRLSSPSRYGDDINLVHMKVEMQTKYRLRIKFYDPESSRYEVPVPKVPTHTSAHTSEGSAREIFLYSVTYDTINKPFAVKVRRSNTDAVLFDTSSGALTLSNQFLELTTKLPSFNLFGLGQHIRKQYHHDFKWETLSMFSAASQGAGSTSGVHPMYLCIEQDGSAHGILLLNSNAMEVQLHPSPAITFRTIGGVLDFYLFLGPSPEEVIQQYTEAIGRTFIPPYWSLGLHVGRSLYQSTSDVEKFMNGFKTKHIPVEALILSQEAVQNVMSKSVKFRDFSNFTTTLSNRSQKILINLEPSISKDATISRDSIYGAVLQQDIFISDQWGLHPIEGERDENAVMYPDFGSSSTILWWSTVLNKLSSALEFRGLWLANNEPLSDTDGSSTGCMSDDLNRPPYVPSIPERTLYRKTLCMDALLHWRDDVITHYDCHNFYGHSMVMATEQALSSIDTMKKKLILSDSTFVGTGQYAGHVIKGLGSGWEGLRASIPAVIELGLYGIALSGTNVCGDDSVDLHERNEELCLRWLQLAVFYPFLQLYGAGAEFMFKEGFNNKEFFHAVRNAISRRYELLPYLYTLFYLAHTKGSTVMRPLCHEYPMDNETYSLSTQFMWGSSLLISPILEKSAKEVNFYLPEGVWYDFYQGGAIYSVGEWFTETGGPLDDSKQPAVLYIRGGHIITLQKPSDTTSTSRQNSMSLLVALNSSYGAKGLLYWDDGETKNSHLLGEYILVDYSASRTSLVVNGNLGKKVFMSNFYRALIQQVRIMGLPKPPKRIVIDSSYILSNKQYHWNYDTNVLDLKHILIPLGRRTELEWIF